MKYYFTFSTLSALADLLRSSSTHTFTRTLFRTVPSLGRARHLFSLCLRGLNPVLATDVVEGQNVAERPVEMVCDRGYLLLQAM